MRTQTQDVVGRVSHVAMPADARPEWHEQVEIAKRVWRTPVVRAQVIASLVRRERESREMQAR